MNIKVVGCGGIGLCVLGILPRYLNYKKDIQVELTLIDGDRFEESNRERQSFATYGNKAEVTANLIRKEFPSIYCWMVTDYLTKDNIGFVIREGNIIFSCVDNHATRKLLHERCLMLKNVVLISGGNDFWDGNIQVHIRREGKDITLPIANKFHQEIKHPTDQNPGEVAQSSCGCQVAQAQQPQLLITNNMIAALMLNAFVGIEQGIFDGKDRYDEVYADVKLNRSVPRNRS
jgi:molybdopterin/thiamine biosynthesis adenylyltransferase